AADVVLDFEFPSPLGVLGLTTRWKRFERTDFPDAGFRPLSGFWV
ncbi:hypothetical protein AN52_02619, partial [Mycobacterium tuberculosis M1026]